jgi:hypothetical protein
MIPLNSQFIKPRYDEGGFASIPTRVENAFASGNYDAVVLFLVDGFGWRFFERFQDKPFFQRLAKWGKVEKISAQFPSTTAAHLTTIHTGLPVGISGVYEWIYYEPELDGLITALLFSHAGARERDTLKPTGIRPEFIYPRGIFYPELKKKGINSFVLGSSEYTPSTYSNVVMAGAEQSSYRTLSEALINLHLLLEQQTKPTYLYLYFDRIDAICHKYGPTAPQAEAEIETFLLMMEYFIERIFPRNKRVLFLMTADHGQVDINPHATVFLNTDPHFDGVQRFIKTNRSGQLLVPAGSPRDMFLHIKDDLLDEAQAYFARRFEGKADVVKVDSLIEEGYFGAEISQRFRERVGNVVILPYEGESVWWYEKNKYEQQFYGHHGGLTSQEMETVLYSYEVG